MGWSVGTPSQRADNAGSDGFSFYSKHTVAQIIELTEIWDAHVTSLQWTYFLWNISFSAPGGLSDRI